jgi:hypothetical protein
MGGEIYYADIVLVLDLVLVRAEIFQGLALEVLGDGSAVAAAGGGLLVLRRLLGLAGLLGGGGFLKVGGVYRLIGLPLCILLFGLVVIQGPFHLWNFR